MKLEMIIACFAGRMIGRAINYYDAKKVMREQTEQMWEAYEEEKSKTR